MKGHVRIFATVALGFALASGIVVGYVPGREVTFAMALGVAATLLLIGGIVAWWVAASFRRQTRLLEQSRAAQREAEAVAGSRMSFLARISHELRTPLSGILGLAEAFRLEFPSGRPGWYANSIQRSGETLLGVVNDVLDYAKVESGDLELETAPFDVEACLGHAAEIVSPSAIQKGLELVLDLDPELPRQAEGDGLRVEQVLLNLLNNAIKFTQEGTVVLSARLAEHAGLAGFQIAVSDTGIGITEAQRAEIFDPFAQADASIARRFGGTGLGLAICDRLVQQMKGTLTVSSTPGEGSTFEVFLPLPVLDTTPVVAGDTLQGKRVMLVETRERTAAVVATMLRGWGAEVVLTTRAEQAPAEELAFDLIVRSEGVDEATTALGETVAEAVTGATVFIGPTPRAEAAWTSWPARAPQLRRAVEVALGGGMAKVVQNAEQVIASGERILVAEDHATNQQVMQLLLTRLGFEPVFASNGAVAVELRKSGGAFTAVLMDSQMPVLDGHSATRQIREWEEATGAPRVPIYGVSAHALPEERTRAMESGLDGYMTKPVGTELLRRTLEPLVNSNPDDPSAGAERPHARSVGAKIDERIVAELVGLAGSEAFGDLLEGYEKTTREGVAEMRAAVADRAEVTRVAHRIKGASRSIGATGFADLCEAVEAAAREAGACPGGAVTCVEDNLDAVMRQLHQARG